MSIGYFIDIARHLTNEERADMREFVNKPNIDIDAIMKVVHERGYNVNELIHWAVLKKQMCHKMGIPEPKFTDNDYINFYGQPTEERKRQAFARVLHNAIVK